MSTETKPVMQHTTEEVREEPRPIGPTTPVQLGVLILLIGAIFGGGWALSALNTKVDIVLTDFREVKNGTGAIAKSLEDHKNVDAAEWNGIKNRVTALETSGSDKARELEKRLNNLENDFRVYKEVTERTKGKP